MKHEYSWAMPVPVVASQVRAEAGRDIICPWCLRVSTQRRRRSDPPDRDNRWVPGCSRTTARGWVCEGCAIDVFNSCNTPLRDPLCDRLLLEWVSTQEGHTVADLRRHVWGVEQSVIAEKQEHSPAGAYDWLVVRLQELMNEE